MNELASDEAVLDAIESYIDTRVMFMGIAFSGAMTSRDRAQFLETQKVCRQKLIEALVRWRSEP